MASELADILRQLATSQLQVQQQMLEMQTAVRQLADRTPQCPSAPSLSSQHVIDSLHKRIEKFIFDPDQGKTLDIWYKRFKDVFLEDGATLDDKQKTRLLVSCLDSATHARFTGHILPKTPADLNWEETTNILTHLFGPKKTLFRRRFDCLKIVYQNEDFDSFANIVNQRCEEAEFKNIDIDGIKCLLFVAGFQAAEFADYRTRLLRTLDQANKLSLKDLVSECQMIKAYKEDAMTLEQASFSVRTVKKSFKKNQQHTTISKSPPYPCPDCGDDHYRNKCPSRLTEETRRFPKRKWKKRHDRYQCKYVITSLTQENQPHLEVTYYDI